LGTLATVAGLAVLAGALTAACGTANGAVTPDPAAVGISSVAGVGTVLVDGHGKALYVTDQDHGTDVHCTGRCAGVWPPAYVSGVTVPAGSAPGVGVLRRSDDGREQLAYHGQPLYEFRLDVMAGQVTGNDVTDRFDGVTFVWHAATVSAAPGC
jgi:predicted lipoprotein with Yx(FWY)xxD motif